MENRMEVPYKTRVTIWSSNPTPGKDENSNSKRYMKSNVHSSTIYNSQEKETTPNAHQQKTGLRKCDICDWDIYTMVYYLAIKRMKYCHLQQHG